MKSFLADLHVHSALSPCAGEEMTPPAIVRAAIERGLAMIAICDHNAAGNTAATQAAAVAVASAPCGRSETGGDAHRCSTSPAGGRRYARAGRRRAAGLVVLAGIEITTAEEVHVVGLFCDPGAAAVVAEAVQATLPDSTDESRSFGEQSLMDAEGRIVGSETKMLSAASSLSLSAVVRLIRSNGGLAVAAHVDRPSFSVVSQLGLFPSDVKFDAIEMFTPCGPAGSAAQVEQARSVGPLWPTPNTEGHPPPTGGRRYASPRPLGLPLLFSSDAHFLADIGRASSRLRMQEPTFDELALAIRRVGGRSIGGA